MKKICGFMTAVLAAYIFMGVDGARANMFGDIQQFQGVIAQTNVPWDKLQGQSKCGGVLPNGRLQAACAAQKATKVGKAVASCPKDSFFDMGTWSCYTCPDGYDRTGNHVDKWDACSKKVPTKRAKGISVSRARCKGSDSFDSANGGFDSRNGGECWKCPSGYGRTWAAVNEYNACGAALKQATGARFISKACPDGSFFDPINGGSCWKCPDGYLRTGGHIKEWNACIREVDLKFANKESALTCKPNEHFDFIDGGTCWTCPAQYDRSLSSVKSNDACQSKQMIWNVPLRVMPGLFGIDGVEDIAAWYVAEQTEINQAIERFAERTDGNLELSRKEEWDLINTAPWNSPILSGLILKSIAEALPKSTSQRTAAERAAIKSLEEWIQKNRLFVATQAKQAYENGLAAEKIKLSKTTTQLQQMMSTVVSPPDYERLIMAGMQAYSGFGMYFSGWISQYGQVAIFDGIAPFRKHDLVAKVKDAVDDVVDDALNIADDLVDDAAKPFFKKAGAKLAKVFAVKGKLTPAGFASASSGPMMIIGAAIMIAEAEIDKFIQLEKLEITIKNRLRDALYPVDLVKMLEHENGKDEFMFHWGALTSGATQPSPGFASKVKKLQSQQRFTSPSATVDLSNEEVIDLSANVVNEPQAAQSNKQVANVAAAAKGTWKEIKGAAVRDVAIGMNGVAYAVSTTQKKGGGQIVSRGKTANKWSPVQGASALRIAVEGRTLWGVDKTGQIYRMQLTKWGRVAGPKAIDIGASAKGVWVVGQDKSVHQWTGKKWQKVPGVDALKVEVDWDGRPLVLGRKGELLVHMGGPKWQHLAGSPTAVDLAVDRPGGARLVGQDGQIYVLNGKTRKWDRVTKGGGMTSIGVGGGQVWIVGRKNQIYRQQ